MPKDAAATLETFAVTKRFGHRTVVNDVHLRIPEGDFFALLGPSGCGKSTLLRTIAGFEKPDAGTIHLRGKDITQMPVRERDINMVFQNYALFPHLTAAENIGFGLDMAKCPLAEKNARVDEAIQLVRLEAQARHLPRQLSGGEQQRVALARALVTRPSLVLLDEPFSALDAKLRSEMQREMRSIQKRTRTTFLLVTHDQAEALSLADHIAIMKEGRIVQAGTPQELYFQPRSHFVATFLGDANTLSPMWFPNSPSSERHQFLLRPEHLKVKAASHPGISATVTETVFLGKELRYRLLTGDGIALTATETGGDQFPEGCQVSLSWNPDDVRRIMN